LSATKRKCGLEYLWVVKSPNKKYMPQGNVWTFAHFLLQFKINSTFMVSHKRLVNSMKWWKTNFDTWSMLIEDSRTWDTSYETLKKLWYTNFQQLRKRILEYF
jgi:hypothetical protein